jgi:hypothetical protein
MVYAHTLTKKNPERNEREKREIWVHQKIDECYSTIIVDNDERHRLYLSNEQVGQINVLACLCGGCCSVCFACERLRVERVCLSLLCSLLQQSVISQLPHTLTQTTARTTEIIKYGPSLYFCHYFPLPLNIFQSRACLFFFFLPHEKNSLPLTQRVDFVLEQAATVRWMVLLLLDLVL